MLQRNPQYGGALLGSLFFVLVSGVTMLALSQFQQSNTQRSREFRDQRALRQLGEQMDRTIQSAAVLRLSSYSGPTPPQIGVPQQHLSPGNEALYKCWRHNSDTLETPRPDCRHHEVHSYVVPKVVATELQAIAGVEEGGVQVYYTGQGDRCLQGGGGLKGLRCSARKARTHVCPGEDSPCLYPLYKAVAQFRALCPNEETVCTIAEFVEVRFLLFDEQGRRIYPRGRADDEESMPWSKISTSVLKGQQCNEGALAKATKDNHLKCECVFPWQPTGRTNVNGEVCFRQQIKTFHECKPEEAVRGFDPKSDQHFGKERSRLQCLKPAAPRTRTQRFKGNDKGSGVVDGIQNGDCKTGWVQSAEPVCRATCDVKRQRGDEPKWYQAAAAAGLTGVLTVLVLGGGFLPGLLVGAGLAAFTALFDAAAEFVYCDLGGFFAGVDCKTYLRPCIPKVECKLDVTCQDFNYDEF